MIPTPDLSHLQKADFDIVYEPAEDTFILLDALEQDADYLRQLSPLVCLEIGSGSGCVSAFVAKILGPSSSVFLSTDINQHASVCTQRTGVQNQVSLNPVTANLVSPLRQRLRHAVDILIFNPPYVPTDDFEADDAQKDKTISGAWAGGLDGMAITDVILGQVEELLSSHGQFYLVAVKQNDVPRKQERMLREHNLKSQVVLQRRAGREHLFVLRFQR